ncbi:MAG: YceI family protein [Solirubrobacterales bacterium]
MATQEEATTHDLGLPGGVWEVDPSASRLEFSAKTMWGLVKVKGHFDDFRGQLLIGDDGAYGELRIDSRSLDTGNRKRDEHLRSADYFDVEKNAEVVFSTTAIGSSEDGNLLVAGILKLPHASPQLELPVKLVRREGGRLRVSGTTSVGRAEAGMDWNRLGMIVGGATLKAELELVPDEQGPGQEN